MFFLTFGAVAVCYLDRQTYFKFLDDIVNLQNEAHGDESRTCPVMLSEYKYNRNNEVRQVLLISLSSLTLKCYIITNTRHRF